jgi:hypothetical protein
MPAHTHSRLMHDSTHKDPSAKPLQATPTVTQTSEGLDPSAILQRALLAPGSLRSSEVLRLQRTLGNRAVGKLLQRPTSRTPLIQAKLTVNAPGDKYEQEPDRVALRVGEQVRTSLREPPSPTVHRQHGQENENTTGIPDHLKAGIEYLSGLSLDDVKVHYNSSKPAQLQALAYTQGTDIHVGPGQEKYLAHEAWHVVQQKQGRVRPTLQMKDGGRYQ